MAACTCGANGDPVTVKENELALIEFGWENNLIQPRIPAVRTGKRVAVVGSGPSGLATADLLNRRGHSVTVYERFDRVGGLMMYGIPNMKLEKHIIDRRVNLMKEEGVTFITNADVGNTIAAEELMEHYDAVVLCCGASNPRDLNNPGRDAQGIHFAVEFLRLNTKSLLDSNLTDGKNISAKGKNVIVVGGGDTGNDCIGTCIRHGCKSITALEMMPEPSEERLPSNPWPQWPRVKKTDYGHEEAIAVFGHDPRLYQTTVKEFHKDENGNLCAVTIVHLESKKDEQTGRFMMVPVEGSEETLPCELLLIAAGFLGSQQYVSQAFGVELNQRTNVKTAAESYKTNVEKVFTAGDMHRGQSLVVWGIAEGRACAREVDEYLMGYTCL
jgi:glutamate synthase (NADPH/NADH) small chain